MWYRNVFTGKAGYNMHMKVICEIIKDHKDPPPNM